ncbi:MAG TPA: membrane dipeptidase [Dokdonella sp.]
MNRFESRRRLLKASAALTAASLLPLSRVWAAAAVHEPSRLYRNAIVIDGNLVPPIDPDAALDKATAKAIRASGLTAIKATIGGSSGDYASTTKDIAAFDSAIAKNPALLMQIRSAADIGLAKRSGKLGIIYSFEGVDMLDGKLERIAEFSARGVRVMQLSYNKPSPFATGVLSPQPSAGLSALGRDAIARMNALGVSLDLSHADEKSTLDAIAVSSRPVLVTHAGCSAVHAHPRNKSDAVLRSVAAKEGVVGIYELSFLVNSPAQPKLDDYLAHMVHALDVCGEDHVGIGSDALLMPFDTSRESMQAWNKDIADRKASGVGAPGEGPPPFVIGLNRPDRSALIAAALSKRGYPDRVLEKVLGANFQRVFEQTWSASA